MRIFVLLLMLCVSLPSWARQFDIEVIIFKRAVNAEKMTESWPNALPPIDMANVGNIRSKGARFLPASSYRLNGVKAKLQRHAGFTVLSHKAWRQGDRGRHNAPIFHIRGGKDYSEQFNSDGSEKSATPIAQEDTNGFTEISIDNPLYELDGKLQIYVQHYLYAETTLDLKAPSIREITLEDTIIAEDSAQLGEVEGNIQVGNLTEISPTVEVERFLKSYRLDQKRRMRSSETHYLDHPLMGVIIQVRRVGS